MTKLFLPKDLKHPRNSYSSFRIFIWLSVLILGGNAVIASESVVMKKVYFTPPTLPSKCSRLFHWPLAKTSIKDYNPSMLGVVYLEDTVIRDQSGIERTVRKITRNSLLSRIDFQGYPDVWYWTITTVEDGKEFKSENYHRVDSTNNSYFWSDGAWHPDPGSNQVPPAEDNLSFVSENGALRGSWTYLGSFTLPNGKTYSDTYKLILRHTGWPADLETFEIRAAGVGMIFKKHGPFETTREILNNPAAN
jgi:hypothetical protein